MRKSSPLKAIFYFTLVLSVGILLIFVLKQSILDKNKSAALQTNKTVNASAKIVNPLPNAGQLEIDEAFITKMLTDNYGDQIVNPITVITKDDVTINGNIKKLASQKTEIAFKIDQSGGKLNAELLKTKISFVSAPKFLREQISKFANKIMDDNINNKYQVANFTQQDGKIIITTN